MLEDLPPSGKNFAGGPLPPNWEIAYSPNGEKYFIDHNAGRTQWEDPREKNLHSHENKECPPNAAFHATSFQQPYSNNIQIPSQHPQKLNQQGTNVSSNSNHEQSPFIELPPGWERVTDPDCGVFYVDHINRRTQFDPPPAAAQPPLISNGYCVDSYTAGQESGNNQSSYPCGFHHELEATKQPLFYEPFCNGENTCHQYAPSSSAALEQANTERFRNIQITGRDDTRLWRSNGLSNATLFSDNTQSRQRRQSMLVSNQPSWICNRSPHFFTRNPAELNGEIVRTRIMRSPNGIGLTLIGNDGIGNAQPEFIQVKNVIAYGPAAENGLLRPGDVLVYLNGHCMLGASQNDACKMFASIPVGDFVDIQVCRGYSLQVNPSTKILTQNVYASTPNGYGNENNNCQQSQSRMDFRRELIDIEICKGPKGFGFTITDSIHGQRVKTVLYPDRCPNLLEGDIIVEVDGKNVRASAHSHLVQMLTELPIGYRCKMVVSRYTTKHRSRTPTAGFRYGYQPSTSGTIGNGALNGSNGRSKTPAPGHRFYQQPSNWGTLPRHSGSNERVRRQPIVELPQQHQIPVNSNATGGTVKLRQSASLHEVYGTYGSNPVSVASEFWPTGKNIINHDGTFESAQPHVTKKEGQMININLNAQPSGFGFRLFGGQEMGLPLLVGEIIRNGAADIDGRIKQNDQIMEIDGKDVEYSSHDDAIRLMKQAGEVGNVKIIVQRRSPPLAPSSGINGTNFSNGQNNKNHLASIESVNTLAKAKSSTPYDVHLIKKSDEEFGCTIISKAHRYIGEILPGSPAMKSNRLHIGDCVIAINGQSTYTMNYQQISDAIKSSGNEITFTIDPSNRMPALSIVDSSINDQRPPMALEGSSNQPHSGSKERETFIPVEISKGPKGFGFSIRGGWEFDEMPLFILRLADDGPAIRTGSIHIGDQVVEINGQSTKGMTHEQAISLIRESTFVRLLLKRSAHY